MASSVPDELLLARIKRESEARAAALDALRAELDAATAELDEKIVAAASKLTTAVGSASALAGTAFRTAVTADSARAEQITAIEAKFTTDLTNANASIVETRVAFADATQAFAEQTLTVQTKFNAFSSKITEQLTSVSTNVSAVATRTETLESQVQTSGTGLLARVSTVESTKVTATEAFAQANSAISASLSSTTAGTIGASINTLQTTKVDAAGALAQANNAIEASLTTATGNTIKAAINTEAEARTTADGNLSGGYTLKVSAGNVVTAMNLRSSSGVGGDVSEIAFSGTVFKIYNGSTNITPFTVNTAANTVTLTNVIVDTLAANVQITTPKILGGKIVVDDQCLICTDQAAGVVRVNGGTSDGSASGGQLDVFGNSHPVAPGSVFLTPGNGASATAAIRDRQGFNRIFIDSSGITTISNGRFGGTEFDVHPNSTNKFIMGETPGATSGQYLTFKVNDKTVHVPFYLTVPT